MLVKGLPTDALVRTPVDERTGDPWTGYHELIAQLIEVTSVSASGRQLRKPVTIKRPNRQGLVVEGEVRSRDVLTTADGRGDNPFSQAISALQQSVPKRRQLALIQGGKEDDT